MVASQLPCLPAKARQPLRERCQVALAIIPISYSDWNRVYECNCELVLIFEEEEDEKKKKSEEVEEGEEEDVEEDEDEDEDEKGDQEYHSPPPSPTSLLMEESHLVEIMDGLYIALVDDEANVPALSTFDNKPFSHVVQVNYTTPYGDDPLSPSNWRREEGPRIDLVQRLGLVCPAASLRLCAEKTAVGPKELHAAREFLTLALPHGSTKWWPEELRKDVRGEQSERDAHDTENEQEDEDNDANVQVVYLAPDHGLDDLLNEHSDRLEQDDDVNVLIIAPTGRAADVLSVLFCYLAFLEDATPDDLVDTDYFDQVWDKATLGRWSMFYVELIARCD